MSFGSTSYRTAPSPCHSHLLYHQGHHSIFDYMHWRSSMTPFAFFVLLVELSITPHAHIHQNRTMKSNGNIVNSLILLKTLLIEMNVHDYVWSNALLTYTYLQNQLPSISLARAISLHLLPPNSLLFSLPLWSFGFIAFFLEHSPSLSNFSPPKCSQTGFC